MAGDIGGLSEVHASLFPEWNWPGLSTAARTQGSHILLRKAPSHKSVSIADILRVPKKHQPSHHLGEARHAARMENLL